jgi:sigma-54 dependent transcriptional regulator, acetoin dehydrogenase operon transcriptional activator AcoR
MAQGVNASRQTVARSGKSQREVWDGALESIDFGQVGSYRSAVAGGMENQADLTKERQVESRAMGLGKFGDQTTHPEDNTGCADLPQGRPALRWLYPEVKWTLLSDTPATLGRSEECATVLRGGEASRQHAEVWREGPIATIRDLSSRNGVFVNGRKVQLAPLRAGDVVRVGEWVALFEHLAPGAELPSFEALAPEWYGGAVLGAVATQAKRAAASDLPIVVLGETGTGKEGLCRAIHHWSGRPGPFTAVNCAALPAELAEAELFGYRKGAFTGAERAGTGQFRAAHQGTLLLDEVTDLPLGVQAKLLRVLEERVVRPIGETQAIPIDVRVVAATQHPLTLAVSERRFRPDLMSRLDGCTLLLPPLRERRADIPLLFLQMIRDRSGGGLPEISSRVIEQLLLYDWPLNVRELVFVVRRLLALHGHQRAWRHSHLPERFQAESSGSAASVKPRSMRTPTDDEAAFSALVESLRAHRGNVTRAASALGITRARAYRLIEARPQFDAAGLRLEQNGEP